MDENALDRFLEHSPKEFEELQMKRREAKTTAEKNLHKDCYDHSRCDTLIASFQQ
jgi:hypothetical protein